jgi:hypothetical protein
MTSQGGPLIFNERQPGATSTDRAGEQEIKRS